MGYESRWAPGGPEKLPSALKDNIWGMPSRPGPQGLPLVKLTWPLKVTNATLWKGPACPEPKLVRTSDKWVITELEVGHDEYYLMIKRYNRETASSGVG